MIDLKQFYKVTGLSKTNFAKASGIYKQALTAYERDETEHLSPETVKRIEDSVQKVLATGLYIFYSNYSKKWYVSWEKWEYGKWSTTDKDEAIKKVALVSGLRR